MKNRIASIWFLITVVFMGGADISRAQALHLAAEPVGTNQVKLTSKLPIAGGWSEVLVRSNALNGHWTMVMGFVAESNRPVNVTVTLSGNDGLSQQTYTNWTFIAGPWNDTLGDEIPPLYKELVLRADPYKSVDMNGGLMHDGWSNIQKLQNNMDPFWWYPPPPPQLSAQFYSGTNDFQHGNAVLTWPTIQGAVPDYFVIARATRSLRRMTNNFYRPGLPPGAVGSNIPSFNPRFAPGVSNRPPPRMWPGTPGTNFPPARSRPSAVGTNRPPNFHPPYFRPPGWRPEDPTVLGPFETIAKVPGQPVQTVWGYRYVDTNVNTFWQPSYKIQAHYNPPLHAHLKHLDTAEIQKTIVPVKVQPTTNGYALTVEHPIPYAWYLLLVRDKSDLQWRASGYFVSGTTHGPVFLHVDKKGMMSDGQYPIVMPPVKYLPDVVDPEFTAGWGEDSDGDGLPDIYEVLVTQTDPVNPDTGDTGLLDGYKDMAGDGLSNLEKFRCRANPLKTAQPPATVELKHPTMQEIIDAVSLKTDLPCDLEIEVKTNGAKAYQPVEALPGMLGQIFNVRPMKKGPGDFDLRISWRLAEPTPDQDETSVYERDEASLFALKKLMFRVGQQESVAFVANLATNPALSHAEFTNKMAALLQGANQYAIMDEMTALQADQAQDFYGKVLDQSGQPVEGADVSVEISRGMGPSDSRKTQTDSEGFFQFTGIRGDSLEATPSKRGYLLSRNGTGVKGKDGPETSITNRAVYTMFKLGVSEPLTKTSFPPGIGKIYQLHHDGSPVELDLLKGAQVDPGAGHLNLQFWRDVSNPKARTYDWKLQLSVTNGGLVETAEEFPFQAPDTGYQSPIIIDMPATNRAWLGELRNKFYVKLPDGKYGEMDLYFMSYNGVYTIQSTINPSGSRNLTPATSR